MIELANFHEGTGWHCEGVVGDSYTLCGDDWYGDTICEEEKLAHKTGRLKDITCDRCLAIIKFCKQLK